MYVVAGGLDAIYHPRVLAERVETLLAIAHTLNVQPGPGGAGMTDTDATCAAFDLPWLHERLPGRWVQARIVGLWPSQQIPAHTDPSIAPAVRYHLPLQVNAECWVFTEPHLWHRLHPGTIYKMDPTRRHGAVNWGETVRLHLMIDVEPEG